jgi:HJR/Mrr/RecB family endonuclease
MEYYAQIWQEEYEKNLDYDYENIKQQVSDSDTQLIHSEYIKQVILCNEIDMSHVQNILIYFLLFKANCKEVCLYDTIRDYENIIKGVKESINSSDIKKKLKTKQRRSISKYTIDDVDLMNGSEFEAFVGLLFKEMGYSSEVTKQSGDQGLDVTAARNGTKIGVQAKCYSNTVGNAAVQEAVAGKNFYNCDKAIVITNNYFTPSAIELAESNGVILWNRDMLKEKIKELM